MKLLLLATSQDGPYLDRFAKLSILRGVQVAVSRGATIRTAPDVALLAKSVGADAVVCTNTEVLKVVLESQYDYIRPNTRRGVTLDDYAGSLLTLHPIPGFTSEMEFLVLNPPEQLQTVSYASFVFERFLSKLIKPQDWYPQTEFKWSTFDGLLDNAADLVSRFSSADLLAVDIETAVGDADRRINCVGICAYWVATNTNLCIVFPFELDNYGTISNILGNAVPKIFQNGMYDNAYFLRFGIPVRNWIFDTQHLFHAWLSELPKRLDFIAAFSVRKIRYWKDDGSTGNLVDYYRYNALDCWATLNTFLGIMAEIPQWGLQNYRIEFPLVFPCIHCAMEGLRVDKERMDVARIAAENRQTTDLTRLRYLLDSPSFNPNSPIQVAGLFKVLGLVLPSTDKASMLKAKNTSQFNELILNLVTGYREKNKLISNYFDEEKIWNGRLYYSLNPAGTDTGRLASKESAYWCGYQIQNIARGEEVKQCLVSDEGWELAEIDKRQSEARCVGYLSGEQKLITLVESDRDYHKANAESFFGVPYGSVDKTLRDLAKRTNHGANYNMGANVMLETMGPKHVLFAKRALRLPIQMRLKEVCAFLLERYSTTYPKVKGLWYESIVKRIILSGQLVSPLGWTRKFFGSPSQNKRDLNAAVAHEPQNLSVGIVNAEFFRIWHSSIYGELCGKIRVKAQVHDSILFEYRGSDTPALVRDKYMNTVVPVTGADGVTRRMFIPSDIKQGGKRWSEVQ